MTDKVVVLSSCGSKEEGQRLARTLVEARLCACVTLLPEAASVYRWSGKLEESTEVLLLMKTRRGLVPQLKAELQKLHTYELPELLALPVVDGSGDYLAWIDRETGGSGEEERH